LVEIVPEKCQPLLITMFEQLNSVVDNYKAGPLITMFDCVGSIAQAVGEGLNNNEILGTLLPLLNKKWEQLNDDDRSLLTLFECFESIVFAIKEAIEPYAKNIFDRCVKILSNVLKNIKDEPENLYVETDFYIRSMDLISSIFSALSAKAEPIVMQSNLIFILREFLDVRDLCIKQYVFAMVGDL
jgi:transportin-1